MQPLKIKTAVLICTFLSVAPLPIFLFFLFIVFGSESLAYEPFGSTHSWQPEQLVHEY
jgi:hypothetical protein